MTGRSQCAPGDAWSARNPTVKYESLAERVNRAWAEKRKANKKAATVQAPQLKAVIEKRQITKRQLVKDARTDKAFQAALARLERTAKPGD